MSRAIEVKTAKLTGAALDWAVAKAAGFELKRLKREWQLRKGGEEHGRFYPEKAEGFKVCRSRPRYWQPSVDWGQAGPLLEDQRVDLHFDGSAWWAQVGTAIRQHPAGVRHESPLVAVCRAIVADRLGDATQVPAELVGGEA